MFEKTVLVAPALLALVLPAMAHAESYSFAITIRAGTLASALQDLARQTGVELLFDRQLMRGFPSPRIDGRMTTETALRRLLNGSGLTMRRAATGAWIVERQPDPVRAAPAPASPDLPVPEILVIGHPTQNFDIRRRENDVQPYQVTGGEEVVRSHAGTIDQYFRSRITSNTEATPPILQADGHTNSQIDLRGLGSAQTLVLVDGRRMPSIPFSTYRFDQADLNAIPLHAIERIETLTGTAGGIYGFGALGGVVNVVLRRDYRGMDLHGTVGASSRGDARAISLEGRIGFTPDGGRTDIMLNVAASRGQPLREGQRGYNQRARDIFRQILPDDYFTVLPVSNAITVLSDDFALEPDFSISRTKLQFKPGYGGAQLGSSYSFLPTGFAGTPVALVAALTQRAGQVSTELSDAQKARSLSSVAASTSAILTIRHDFGGGLEAYMDALFLRNVGRAYGGVYEGHAYLTPDMPENPFENSIEISFPIAGTNRERRIVHESQRYTAGLIAPLPHGWKATAEATFGFMHYDEEDRTEDYPSIQTVGDGIAPFGDWNAFQQAIIAVNARASGGGKYQRNRFDQQSLRLAGRLFATAAGPATLTLLAERRREAAPSYTEYEYNESFTPLPAYTVFQTHDATTTSLYAELKAPLTGREGVPFFLRGLEVQFAARRDVQKVSFAGDDPNFFDINQRQYAQYSGTVFTAGAKLSPLPWLMLRGSYATGKQPPDISDLISREAQGSLTFQGDPKRGDTLIGLEGDYVVKSLGSPDLGAIHASTLSLGMVLNPMGDGAPRLSVDYSRIHRTRDVYRFLGREELIVQNEGLWPERVGRAPLTEEDRALGYAGGVITMIDERAANLGGLRLESLDVNFDWVLPFLRGKLRTYAAATVQLSNIVEDPFNGPRGRLGYSDGPLPLRLNGGVEWTNGRWTMGSNAQYFSRYRIVPSEYKEVSFFYEGPQGSQWVRPQLYVDLNIGYRFALGSGNRTQEINLEFGVLNIFDQIPPYVGNLSAADGGYSFYGDPRGRRFELGLGTRF